jgi:hypothetical protein
VWNSVTHSYEENLRWCKLRAMEWARWPLFISQPIVPILLSILQWEILIPLVFFIELYWSVYIRYRFVNVNIAFIGPFISKVKWLTCPAMGFYFFFEKDIVTGIIALLWPIIIFPVGFLSSFVVTVFTGNPAMIGIIQNMFMAEIGCSYQDNV